MRMTHEDLHKMLSKGKRPKGMGYGDYSSMMKAAGKKPMSREDYEDMEEDEDTEKSIDSDALVKAMNAYETVAETIGVEGGDREAYLRARLENNTITKSERVELGALLAGTAEGPSEPLRKSLDSRIDDADPASGRLVRANDFLKSMVYSVDDALDNVYEAVSRENAQTRDLVKSQGDVLRQLGGYAVQLGELVKSQSEVIDELRGRLGMVERQPVPPRSQRPVDPRAVQTRTLAKSSVSDEGGQTLSKAQINAGFRHLVKEAHDSGDGQLVKALTHEAAKYETTRQIKRSTYEAIAKLGR